MKITPHMHQAGITPNLVKTRKMIKCPYCNKEFNIMYSRAIACQGCTKAVLGCNLVRCPNCDREFPLTKTGVANTERSARNIDKYLAKLLSTYYKDFGERPGR
ncbi:MAG: hypothetical protein ACFFCW_37200 [Candidatus Hodarchaeota archaeon]